MHDGSAPTVTDPADWLRSTLADIGAAVAALQGEAGLPRELMPTRTQLEQHGAQMLLA